MRRRGPLATIVSATFRPGGAADGKLKGGTVARVSQAFGGSETVPLFAKALIRKNSYSPSLPTSGSSYDPRAQNHPRPRTNKRGVNSSPTLSAFNPCPRRAFATLRACPYPVRAGAHGQNRRPSEADICWESDTSAGRKTPRQTPDTAAAPQQSPRFQHEACGGKAQRAVCAIQSTDRSGIP
jgi:hypothetical protein